MAGAPLLGVAGAAADGVSAGVAGAAGEADVASGLAELVPGTVVACVCGWLGPQPLSIRAAAAAAVVITNPCDIR
jgi:hypothetical protein